MRKAFYGLGAALLVGAVACGPAHSHLTPQAKATVSALASVPGADAQQILIRAGVPINGTSGQQIAFAKAMMHRVNRDALAQKLQIPQQNRSAFEAALLTAAKADHVLTSHAGRVKWLTMDLPNLFASAL